MRLRASQFVGYAAGDVANNLTFSTVSAFLLIYYTDVAGISAAAAGTLFIVVRVWGGMTDLFAGRRVDATQTRWGRFRPYLLFGSAPLLLSLVAMFSIPGGLGEGGKVAWAYVTYALFSLAYSFVNIPYGSLSAAMTQAPDERAKLSSSRAIASSLTVLTVAVVVSPQVSGGGNLQRSLTITTLVFAVVGFALYMWCFAVSRETVERGTAAISVRQTAGMLRHNRPLLLLCASGVLFLGGMFSLQTVGVYYARDVLGDADLFIVLTLVQTVGMILASVAMPTLARVLGKQRTYVIAAVFAAGSASAVAVAPGSTPAIGVACFGLLGFGLGLVNTLIFALQADTVEYGEWDSGIRAEGSSYAALSFSRKLGQGVGGGIAAFTIGLGGYVSGAADQPSEAVTAIRAAAGGLPAVLFLGAAAVMLAYPLTEARFRRILTELTERRARDALGAPPG